MGEYIHARTAIYNIGYHMTWSTKYRKPILVGEIEVSLKSILLSIAKDSDFSIREMEVMPDHVHVFVRAHPKHSPSSIYKALKGGSGRKLFALHPAIRRSLWGGALWNPSTFTETIGHISEGTVIQYIRDQKTA
jgi:putative transposase